MTEQQVLAPPGIFKAYDIRGIYGTEMDETTALAVGRAFARVLGRMREKPPAELRVGLGRDMRPSAPSMAQELRDGLIFEGVTVVDAGMIATEMLYELVGSHELDGGAMVTPSHNPKGYTGIKLVREGALALSGDAGIGDVRREIEAGLGPAPGGGSFEEVDIWDQYRERALSFIDPAKVKPMQVVVDGSNGMAGPMVGPILEQLGLDPVPLFFVPDGDFPGHGPNPLLEENQRLIIERVRSKRAPISGSPGTETPTAAFSSTSRVRSATAISSARCLPAPRWQRSPGRRSSTTPAPAGRCRTRSPPRGDARR